MSRSTVGESPYPGMSSACTAYFRASASTLRDQWFHVPMPPCSSTSGSPAPQVLTARPRTRAPGLSELFIAYKNGQLYTGSQSLNAEDAEDTGDAEENKLHNRKTEKPLPAVCPKTLQALVAKLFR